MKVKILVALLSLLVVFTLLPDANAQNSVHTGDKVAKLITTYDQEEDLRDFESLRGENGLVLVFFRSAEWCPYCQAQLIDLNEHVADIKDHGYNLAGLSYDQTHILEQFTAEKNIGFPLLSDPSSSIIKAFGILNTEMKEGTKYYGVPHPHVYVLDAQGVIKADLAAKSYDARPTIEDILNALE